jgi:5-methylcytosine-specific restriction endonuclease McrA
MRFNNLVAIEKAPSRGGHTYWKFRCDCSNEKEIMACHVISGVVKSCGCLFEEMRTSGTLGMARDLINDNDLLDSVARVCKICEMEFFGLIGDKRLFCYNCSPRGTHSVAYKAQKRAMKHILVEYKGGKCIECGYDQCEGSLQFHHIDGTDKDFTLSAIKPNKISMDEFRAEADKCVLLCANCHAKKHEVMDKVAAIMKISTVNTKNFGTRKCKVCSAEFLANLPTREYCYECAPMGLKVDAAMRFKKRAMKRELLKYKGGAVCMICGFDDYEGALQLHHRNPKEKEFTLSSVNLNDTDYTMEKLKAEADKCDVLCANCHFEVHYKHDDDLNK